MTIEAIDANQVRLFKGSSNPPLVVDNAPCLGLPLEKTEIKRFSNDNPYIQLGASVRSRTVFIIQSLSPPVNDHLMELLMMVDIARSAAAQEVHAIIPLSRNLAGTPIALSNQTSFMTCFHSKREVRDERKSKRN